MTSLKKCVAVLTLLAGLLPLLGAPAMAAQSAQATLSGAIDEIMGIIRKPAYANAATRGPLRRQVEDIVRNIFDFGAFSSRTVGPAWRRFSPEEKERFVAAFSDLLFNTYLSKVTGYNGEVVEYTGEKSSPDGKRVEIMTLIQMKDGRKIPVAYRMLPAQGGWKVYDVIIENVSLVKNYNTQFQSILNSGSPDQLIGLVRDKARQMRENPGSVNNEK